MKRKEQKSIREALIQELLLIAAEFGFTVCDGIISLGAGDNLAKEVSNPEQKNDTISFIILLPDFMISEQLRAFVDEKPCTNNEKKPPLWDNSLN